MDFRKKLLGFAGLAMVSASLAYGQQTTCTNLTPVGGPLFIRAEGQTEQLPPLTLSCAGVAGSSLNLTIFLSPAVPVTSKLLTGTTTEATAAANTGGTVQGSVVGSSVVFTAIPLTAATTTITITNVRVNVTGIPSAVGAPPQAVTAQAFVGGTLVTPGANTNSNPNVAFVLTGLGTTKVTKDAAGATNGVNTSPFGVCGSLSAQAGTPAAPTPQFYVQIGEGFQNAFMTAAQEASQTPITVSGVNNNVNSGTRVKLVFSNVPTGLQLYVPTTINASNNAAVLTLTASETGGISPVPAITGQSNLSSFLGTSAAVPAVGQLSVSGTTSTAVYEVTNGVGTSVDQYTVPVYAIAGADTLAAQTAAMSLTVSLAPITAATTVPSFGGTVPASINTISFVVCQTNLLFPFVTNASGFETGIAISNTSKDPFTSNNAAKPQNGTCVLNFYGTSGTNPTAVTAPNLNEGSGMPYVAGESYAFTLSSALAVTATNPATFQGYVIAQCNFNYAHGFAYITYAFPGTSSDTMGYLAVVLNRGAVAAVADSNGN